MNAAAWEEERQASTRALLRLLQRLAESDLDASDEPIFGCLRSQGALATYSCQQEKISACSLNTLKRSCIGLSGGFQALDDARKRLLASLQSSERPAELQGTSKRRIERRNKALSEKLGAASEDLMLLTHVLGKAMRQSRQYAAESRDAAIIERCRREQAELRDMLSLRRVSSGPVRIVPPGD